MISINMISKVLSTAELIRKTINPDLIVVNRTQNLLKIISGCRLTSYKIWRNWIWDLWTQVYLVVEMRIAGHPDCIKYPNLLTFLELTKNQNRLSWNTGLKKFNFHMYCTVSCIVLQARELIFYNLTSFKLSYIVKVPENIHIQHKDGYWNSNG